MKLYKLIILLLFAAACSPYLKQDGDVYLYEGREEVIVTFRAEPSIDELDITAEMIKTLKDNIPNTEDSVLVEGLSGNYFYDFFRLGDALFSDVYKNRTIVYAYIAFLVSWFVTCYGRANL